MKFTVNGKTYRLRPWVENALEILALIGTIALFFALYYITA